jgi:adenylate cyclase
MAIEIERKFLLKQSIPSSIKEMGIFYMQGYLNETPERTLRIRTAGEKAYLTIKGKMEGLTRLEFEYEIPLNDAKQLLLLCIHPPIEKTRYKIKQGSHTWEVDVFHGENEGLVLAEIELQSESEKFEIPDWIGDEVTSDFRFYNSYLSAHPYKTWK